ncbi:ATP-binding cassette domain-containing protein [Pseudorhodoferax sp.]|uniref:ATP-binding cassette domain-containing protein n=1 Tax=Pseudorhodoferax sp. TaxID=1993553 RepID=UPI0039E72351
MMRDEAATLAPPPLLLVLVRLAALQREAVDRLALQEAASSALGQATPQAQLATVTDHLQLRPARWYDAPDDADLPALLAAPDGRWGILRGRNTVGRWIGEWPDPADQRWRETAHDGLSGYRIATLRLQPPYRATSSPVLKLVLDEMLAHKGLLAEAGVGGLLLAFLGLLISFYSMQLYDRVIPTGATQTLGVLTLGILLAIGLEYLTKRLRSRLYDRLIDRVDQRLARAVYLRFLSIRLDQMPASVGTLAGQLRGYESVRAFLVAVLTQLAIDAPFALVFAAVIAAIAGPLAFIPLIFFALSLARGLWHGARMRKLAEQSQETANLKTGLLVESVEAAEIIKSGQGGWRMLGRWLASTDTARDVDQQMRHLNEKNLYGALATQQVSYVLLMACGAWMASRSELTLGGLIACSILAGRVLNPVTQIGQQIGAWANVKAALRGLDALWTLEDDHGQSQPVHLENLRGHYRCEQVVMSLRGRPALKIGHLQIRAGEKIGVLGAIGAGKTTLLRLLSGMYKPGEGRIWLDDVDLAQLSKPLLAEHLGYLPQDGRLLGGSLRDNLVLGLLDPGDDAILAAARTTGLFESVIAPHPSGLQQAIAEGGSGLSGGQRQLVNLTRVFLRRPTIWLLDEPTASLDRHLELQLLAALKRQLRAEDTLVLVTHKPEMLQLVDRLLVVGNGQILLDGPRDAILARLQGGLRPPAPRVAA